MMQTSSSSTATESTIHVCQARTCRRKGSEAVLVEIEELANFIDDSSNNHNCYVSVDATDCLGYCSQGPAVYVDVTTSTKLPSGRLKKITSKPQIHVRVNTFEKSAGLVAQATGGQALHLENIPPETKYRLAKLKKKRAREYAVSTYQWNKALSGLEEEVKEDPSMRTEMRMILAKSGYDEEFTGSIQRSIKSMPTTIQDYVQWSLQSVQIISSHSAIFKLSTNDRARSTPHPRGSGKLASPITWHVTMLGEVGINDEGPLPWIERDYTPISSALEWERGRVDLLIKVYNMGQLTSWLRRSRMIGKEKEPSKGNFMNIWLSKPLKTLSVPSLMPEDEGDGFIPKSVLLLLAGTGVVALPQILAHREPSKLLGIPTPMRKQLHCPIDLILSCREDDVLMIDEIKTWCIQGAQAQGGRKGRRYNGLRNCTLLITEKCKNGPNNACDIPFPDFHTEEHCDWEKLKEYMNICSHRLNQEVILKSLEKMVQPCRVVVSGPDSFNQAARKLLEECSFPTSTHLTVLSA
jgi:hypothetical protein